MSALAQRNRSDEVKDLRWWKQDVLDVHEKVVALVDRIRTNQPWRREMDLHHARLYGNYEIPGLGLGSYAYQHGFTPPKLGFNLVARNVDTLTAKIAKNRPLPMFLTSGGDYSQQRKARQLGKFINGLFYETKQFELSPEICRDAAVFGTGIQKLYVEDDDVCIERVFPWEILVDTADAQYGKPRSLYQRKWVDRLVLMDRFPAFADQIEEATCERDIDEIGYDSSADQLLIIEAWHLPSGKKAKDGRHAIVLENLTLHVEDYAKDYFPFAFLHKKKPVIGFWGTGLAQELTGIQYETNVVSEKIQESFAMTGSYWLLDNGSKILDTSINNDVGTIIRYSGTPPQKYDPPAVNQDQIQYLNLLLERSSMETGVSEMSQNSQKPAGLNAGEALRVYNDVESERFVLFGKAYEQFHIDVATIEIDLVKELDGRLRANDNDGYSVRARSKRQFDRINWKDVDLERDAYVMQVFPTSMLSKTAAGRIQQVQDLANAGWLTPEEAKQLLDFPDLEHFNEMWQAKRELIESMLEAMMEHGDYQSPEPFMDLTLALQMTQQAYQYGRLNKVPEDNLELLRQFMEACNALLNPPQMPGPPPMDQGVPPPMPPTPDMGGGPPPMMPPPLDMPVAA